MNLDVAKKYLKEVFIGNFGLSRFWWNEQNQTSFTSKILYRCDNLDRDFDGVFKLEVSEKYKFDYRAKCVKLALSGTFELSRLSCRGQNSTYLDRTILYNYKSFDADPDGRDKPCSFGEIWSWKSRKSKLKRFLLEISE